MGKLYESEEAAVSAGIADPACRLMCGFRLYVRGSRYGILPDGCAVRNSEVVIAHYLDCGHCWIECYD